MLSGLFHKFVGTWKLISYESRSDDGVITYPFGRDAEGYIMYTQDGYMSVAWHRKDRRRLSSNDFTEASMEEKAAAAESYYTYYGRFEVKGNQVVHHVEGSIVPNWVGVDRERFFRFDGNRLILTTDPVVYGGRLFSSVLVWEKA